MQSTPVTVRRIEIFPVKSCDGVAIKTARLLPAGPIEHDRCWAFFDDAGKIINAKRFPQLQTLRTEFTPEVDRVTVRVADSATQSATLPVEFDWPAQANRFADYVAEFLGIGLRLAESTELGYPDDTIATGPTLIGSATLDRLSAWFPELTTAELRRRFRANIELETTEPFWEDRLFGPPGEPRLFQIGAVEFWGINPCQRCAVPARDSHTGQTTTGFQKQFSQLRQQTLPDFVASGHFNHFYRLAVNTQLCESTAGQVICVGDTLSA